MKFIKNNGGRENYFPVDKKKDATNDCVVRAIAIATEQDYLVVRDCLFDLAKEQGRMPNDDKIYEAYLSQIGWVKKKPMRNKHNRKLRLHQVKINTNAIFITSGHVCAVINNDLNDRWDCRNWCANSYYVKGTK